MNPDIFYQIQTGPFWDWRVALDLFLGGAGVGALLFAVFIDERFKGKYKRICHTAAWLAPVLIGAGLLLIMLKMGRPLKLFLAYTNFNPSAPLWWGGIFQPLLLIGAVVYALKWRQPQPEDASRKWLGRLLVPVGLIVGTYHGMLLSVMVSRPLWNTGPTVVAALLGFASTGIAVVMLVHLIRMRRAGRLADEAHVGSFLDDLRVVRNTLVAVLVLQLGTCFLWWLSLLLGALQDQQALAAANAAYGPMFWWLGIGLGIVLPLALGAYAVWRGEAAHRRLQITMIGLTSVLILIGGFFFRLALVLGGQIQLTANGLF
ncbi:MAG: NrfD/PsrC family molybdoenzyme membrane anchor subunit [Rhodothermales bacterium]